MLYVGLDYHKRYTQVMLSTRKHRIHFLVDRVQMDRTFQERIGTIQAGIRKGREPRIARRQV